MSDNLETNEMGEQEVTTTSYGGSGVIESADFKTVTWEGKTKNGKAVKIYLYNALCISNIDLKLAEKDDIVPEIEFEGCYVDGDSTNGIKEPWKIEGTDIETGAITLGLGKFSVGGITVGLTRGGGQFTVEREFREINADGDRGKVKNRVALEGGRPKLKMNALQWLENMSSLYSGITTTPYSGT